MSGPKFPRTSPHFSEPNLKSLNASAMEMTTRALPALKQQGPNSYIIGLILAILSSLFIGTSFIIKKLSLKKLSRQGGLRAGAGGFGYLRDWMWWLGFITMGVGELANFAAYAFAPASLVTPLGALSVLVSALLASKFLKETINSLGKLGCLLCVIGSIIVIIHSPKEQEVHTVNELLVKLHNPIFINYIIIVIISSALIIFYLGPRYGARHVLIYTTLCASIGSLTVMACKGLGLAVAGYLEGPPLDGATSEYTAIVFFAIVVACICVQMNYLNKALDLFDTSVVTPVYYVMFTALVIVASGILFEEWKRVSVEDVMGNGCGFVVVIVAIYLLQGCKDAKEGERHREMLLRGGTREYGSGRKV